MKESVHNGGVRVGLRDGYTVEVRELSWPDAMKLYQRLMAQAAELLTEEGQMRLTPQQVVKAISENVELGQWLALKSTGKDQAWLEERTLSEVMDVAIEAAVLNAGIIADRIKNARSRLRGVFGPEQAAAAGPKTQTQ